MRRLRMVRSQWTWNLMPNVRGKAGPTVKRQAHAADDSLRCRVGLAFCRWGSPLTEGLGAAHRLACDAWTPQLVLLGGP